MNTRLVEVPIERPTLRATWAKDYGTSEPVRAVVGNLIESGSLVCVFGESNTGKSTFVIDLLLHACRGIPWRDRRTRSCVAVYLPLEGARGVRQRVRAKILHDDIPDDLPFVDLTGRNDLLDLAAVRLLIETLNDLKVDGRELVLVVDTVARALGGGDENSGQDMGALIAGCDMIRSETGATVILVHHAGKDSTKGARGHSSLRAAVDTEIEVCGVDNPRTATVRKQRDLPIGDVFAFDLEPVEIGKDPETFDEIRACVVVHRDDVPTTRHAPTGRAQRDILRALVNRQSEADSPLIWTIDELRKIGRDLGHSKSTARYAVIGLGTGGFLTPTVGGHRLADGVL